MDDISDIEGLRHEPSRSSVPSVAMAVWQTRGSNAKMPEFGIPFILQTMAGNSRMSGAGAE